MTATAKSIAKNRISAISTVDTKAEVTRGTLVSIGAAGAVVTMWSFASLVGAIVVADGPFSLAKAWLGAVGGL